METKTGSLVGRCGGEEQLKQLVLDFRRDAGAVVAHLGLDGPVGVTVVTLTVLPQMVI